MADVLNIISDIIAQDKAQKKEQTKIMREVQKRMKANEVSEEEGDKEEYMKFFASMLKKYGVKSPAELSDEDKKKFFDEVDAGWEGDNEPTEESEDLGTRVKNRLQEEEPEDEKDDEEDEGEDDYEEDEGEDDYEEDEGEDDESIDNLSDEDIEKLADIVLQKLKDKADEEEDEEEEPDTTEAEKGKKEKIDVNPKMESLHRNPHRRDVWIEALRQVSMYEENQHTRNAIQEVTAPEAVKHLLKTKFGGRSLGKLSPDEKKKLFNMVDDMVKAKNEEVDSVDEIFGLSAKEKQQKELKKYQEKERAKREKRVRIQKNYGRYGLMAKEERELNESDYPIYHKSYTSAIDAARAYAKKRGYDFDEDSYFNQVSSGQRKPSPGKTNMMRVQLTKDGKPTKKGMQIQVYGMDNGSYELNTYVESFNIQEKSLSQVQQKLMGMAYAYKKGEMDDASDAVKKLADSMTLKQLKDFASTKHEGLPMRKEEYIYEAAPKGSNKIDPELRYAINNLLDRMADFEASSYRKSPNYAKFKDDFEEIINDWEKHLSYKVLGKYIRIDTKHGVEKFIVKDDGDGYKKGDVLRPKGWKGPNLRAGVHGNILDPNYRIPGMMEETMKESFINEEWIDDELKKVSGKWEKMSKNDRKIWMAKIKEKAKKEDMSNDELMEILDDYGIVMNDPITESIGLTFARKYYQN